MTTAGKPEDRRSEPDELLALPAHPSPWLNTGYRDENARLLVDAMYLHRDALLQDFADVPVQGYQVLPADQPSGGLTCGTLISLWRGNSLCRGACPMCGELSLTLAIGGTDDDWMVMGVCRFCAHLSHRPGVKADLLAELDRGLEQSRFTLPSVDQLLSTNAHQHSAMLSALVACGAVMLPAPAYGFMVSMPKAMQGWANPVRARAWHWSWNATIRHVPTGARVERTAATMAEVADLVEWHLLRTGRLPELEHDGLSQLRYEFPMISQELVTSPPRPSPQLSEYIEAADDDTHQLDVDALIASVLGGTVDANALRRVTEWLDATNAAHDGANGDPIGLFLSPDAIAAAYKAINEGAVRELNGLTPRQRVTCAQRIEYLELYVLPDLSNDADVTRLFAPVVLRATSGDEMTMVAGIQGYSFTEIRTEWWGPVESASNFAFQLERSGWVEGVEGFERLTMKRKSAIATG